MIIINLNRIIIERNEFITKHLIEEDIFIE